MVDTGASSHVLTATQAQRYGLLAPTPASSDGIMLEWEGRPSKPVSISVFEGRPSLPISVPVFGAKEALSLANDDSGIAGTLSPQRLVGAGEAVELDMRGGWFSHLGPGASVAARNEVAQRGARLGACSDGTDGFFPVVAARIDSRNVALAVDTGSALRARQ